MKTLELNGITYINLTPHEVVVQRPDGSVLLAVPASGELARVSQDTVWGDIEGLPAPQPNTVYIVSGVLAQKLHREDVRFPNQLIRDELGHVVACLSFGK